MNEQVRRRQLERHCAASIRAIGGNPDAEFRRQSLFIQGKRVPQYTPHLVVDVAESSLERCRGVADAMALRLAFSDSELHRQLAPDNPVEQLLFDILEQLRVESVAPDTLAGVRLNLDQAFTRWCRHSRGSGLVENELGLLIYSVIQMARSRLNNRPPEEAVEDLIEAARFRLVSLIGEQMAQLYASRHDQVQFASLALIIAAAIKNIIETAGGALPHDLAAFIRQQLLIPPSGDDLDRDVEGSGAGAEAGVGIMIAEREQSYHVFTRAYDKQVSGESLYRKEQRIVLRQQLDALVAAQAVSIPRLAQRLQRLFAIRQRAGWDFGQDEGYIDGRRLSQLVSNPAYRRVFKQEKHSPYADTVVTFLVDNSGSMKRQRFEAVTVLVDIYCRALQLAGVKTELLGFTTGGWSGGESIRSWRADGMPSDPGRINDRLHIVYKDADTSWRRARYAICSMLNPVHYREGLDGEALRWANERLRSRVESRKCLVMISDGAPMDSATSQNNKKLYLEHHLRNTAQHIENNSEIELRAIGIALDMDEYFSQSIALDLTGTLGNQVFQALEHLFSTAPLRTV